MVPTFLLASSAEATEPSQVSFTLEGCKTDGSITLPNGDGDFICPDSAYTTGNLGKGWNELDLVPHRVTADAGNAAPANQTYTIAVALDREDAGAPGYDVLSAPVLNASLSSSACTAPSVGAQTIKSPGLGGTDETIYRLVTITQAKNTKCVYDFYGRLALGSHLFPGSSLHANLGNETLGTAGIGSKEVSIPVKEILPQELSKEMTASRGSDFTWNITKESTPASLNLGNTCEATGDYVQKDIAIKVTWTKSSAIPGKTTITTNIYATNPASRTITVTATDKIYAGATQTTLLDQTTLSAVDVPANTTKLLGTHTIEVDDATLTSVNDVATATYTDKATGVAVPGTTQATASATVQSSGSSNATADVTDSEKITGTGLEFKVATPSVGTFTSYTAGDWTTGPVDWKVDDVSSSGSVTFNKTVRAAKGTVEPDGELSDTATITTSGGISSDASLSSAISVDTRATLTIEKSIPDILQGSETQTFTFKVKNSNGDVVDTPSITFTAGETSDDVDISDLAPDTYTVSEDAATGWKAQNPQNVDLTGTKCSGKAEFTNEISKATAKVKKVTIPAGFAKDWTFDLFEVGDAQSLETVTTTGADFVNFTTPLDEATYQIIETNQDGWSSDGGSASCTFTVDYPADAGKVFECTYTNTYQPSVTLDKSGDSLSKKTDKVTYTFDVTNTSKSGGAAGAPSLTCVVKDDTIGYTSASFVLAPGSTKQLTQEFTMGDPNVTDYNDGAAGTAFKNTAKVECTYGTGAVVASSTDDWTTNLFEPSVKLTKTGPSQATVGQTVTYDIKIENTSSADSPNLVFDSFSDSRVSGVTPPASCDNLAPGDDCSFSYTYTVKAGDYTGSGSTISNTATVHYHPSGFPNDITSSDTWTVSILNPSFTITKDCLTNNVPAGAAVTFGVDVTNTGGTPLVIVLTDSIPLNSTNTVLAIDSDPTTLNFNSVDGTVRFTVQPGDTVKLEISTVASGTEVVNNVSATATIPSSTVYSETKTASAKCDVISGATRTIGFWRTHLTYATHILDQHALTPDAVHKFDGTVLNGALGVNANGTFTNGYIDIGWKKLYSVQDVMGVLWADTSKQSTGKKRDNLCQARVITSKQLVGAILNTGLDNAAPVPNDLIAKTITALKGTNQKLIKSLGSQLDAYNNSGDDVGFIDLDGTLQGSANPRAAEAYANKSIANC
jgi:hypothetical protein